MRARAWPLLAVLAAGLGCHDSKPPPAAPAVDAGTSALVRVLPPREGSPRYLVVMLHGYGADAASFEGVARRLSQSVPHAEFLIPDGFDAWEGGSAGRQWFSLNGIDDASRIERVRAAGARLSAWMDVELQRRGLTAERLVVVGFSQGAMLAGWLAVHRGPRPSAVVMLSGRGVDLDAPRQGLQTQVFIGHGELDKLIPPEEAAAAAAKLEAWGVNVTQRTYRGISHGISPDEMEDVGKFLYQVTEAP